MSNAVSFKVVPAPQPEIKPETKLDPAPAAQPAAPAEPPAQAAPMAPKPRKSGARRLILGAALIAALAAAGWYGNDWYQVGRFTVSTDDAYVKAEKSALSSKLAGLVAETPVASNGEVRKGEVVMRLDDTDYSLALRAADSRIASQNATMARIEEQRKAQDAVIAKATAQLALVKSDLAFAQARLQRQSTLASQQLTAAQTKDDAASAVERAQAQIASAEADLQSATAQQDVIVAQATEARQQLAELQVARDRAQHDLDQTIIRAPFDGTLSSRSAEVGQYVQPGQRLAFLVPKDQVYVEANFKETDVAGLHEGQDVTLHVDALKQDIHGKVESISPASGSEFSLLPPENATGNFTKVVQRVPVRIAVGATDAAALRAGFSVTASINTKG